MAAKALGQAVSAEIVGGIAKPLDSTTLGIFQGLQRAINVTLGLFRSGGVSGVPGNITTDGDIGPRTLSAAQFVARQLALRAPDLPPIASTIQTLSLSAATFTNRLGQLGSFSPNFTPDPATARTRVPAPTAPTPPAPGPLVPVPDSLLPEPLAPPSAPGKKPIHFGWWLGGIVLITVIGVAIFIGRKPKQGMAGFADEGDDADDFDASAFGYEPAGQDFIDI